MRWRRTPAVAVRPSASRTEEGARETGKGCVARTSRRSKAVGEGSVGSKGFKVASARNAEVNEASISVGRRGPGPPRKPIAFCARRLSRASLRGSPPVPACVCSLSPVSSWRQERGRLAARAVKPACPPCCPSSMMERRTPEIKAGMGE